MEIKDLGGLSQPLTKLIEVIKRGIGTLYEPTHIKRMAKAKSMEIETISSAIENSNLKIQYNDGKINMETSTKEIMERAERRKCFQEVKKQKNIEDVIIEAYNNLEVEEKVSEEPLQEEWISRFFDSVGGISSDELKKIWGKILSEEIKEPGKCSIRTLEVLRNLSREEAEIFKKISNYIIKSEGIYFLPDEKNLLAKFNIYCGEILKLDEASLINMASDVVVILVFNQDKIEENLIYNNEIITCKKDKKDKVKLNAFCLTEAGRNIFDILIPDFNEEYFKDYIDIIKKEMKISYSKIE